MIGMRTGMGTKYGADTQDEGAYGAPQTEPHSRGKRKRRRAPKNIKGLLTGTRAKKRKRGRA